MDDLIFLSATEMAEGVRRKKFSALELVEAHLGRIDRLDPRLNAFVTVDGERAQRQAKVAEIAVARGEHLGPLHGVPITIKSSIDVAGLRCAAGSRLRAGYVPEADAPLVARLRAAGAILLGNTNVPEFLMAYETDNALYGRTNNPWDLERTPGGSSGGEAAAIAAACSPAGVGSDGGGSIRIPAQRIYSIFYMPIHFPEDPDTPLSTTGPMRPCSARHALAPEEKKEEGQLPRPPN